MNLAKLYLISENTPKWIGYKRPKELRRDSLGRAIFEDGSWVEWTVTGDAITGEYSPTECRAAEVEAFHSGKWDRLNGRCMNRDFVGTYRRYPSRICKGYRDGWYSVADWPKYQRKLA